MTRCSNTQMRAIRLAPVMFALSVLFVLLLATLIVLWVDIPRVAELSVVEELAIQTSAADSQPVDQAMISTLVSQESLVKSTDAHGKIVQLALLVLWPVFWLDYVLTLWHERSRPSIRQGGWIRLLACAIPPMRLAAPSAAFDGQLWLPVWQWRYPGKTLNRDLERAFGKPMLIIALLILPILLIEYGLQSLVEQHEWLQVLLHVSTGFIWCAFTIEFLIMISATDKRLLYIKTHWIDLVIILLPLVSFLRSLRVLRVAKITKLQKLAKMGRVFRVRGLLMKALRAMMLLGFVNRLLRITPEKRLSKLKAIYADQAEDLRELKAEIDEIEAALVTPELLASRNL